MLRSDCAFNNLHAVQLMAMHSTEQAQLLLRPTHLQNPDHDVPCSYNILLAPGQSLYMPAYQTMHTAHR